MHDVPNVVKQGATCDLEEIIEHYRAKSKYF